MKTRYKALLVMLAVWLLFNAILFVLSMPEFPYPRSEILKGDIFIFVIVMWMPELILLLIAEIIIVLIAEYRDYRKKREAERNGYNN